MLSAVFSEKKMLQVIILLIISRMLLLYDAVQFYWDCATYSYLAFAKIMHNANAPAQQESDITWDMKNVSQPQCFLQC